MKKKTKLKTRKKRKPKKLNDTPARWKRIKEKYGLSKADYNKILLDQGGVCFICQRTPQQIRRKQHLAVDHDHATGAIRGLLCFNCNHAILGKTLRDNLDTARRIVEYLSRSTDYGKVPS